MKKPQFSRIYFLALGILALASLLLLLLLQLKTPADGYADKDGLMCGSVRADQSLTAAQTGLQRGDEILAINGQSIAQLREWAFTFKQPAQPLQVGRPAVYSLKRDGAIVEIQVIPTRLKLTQLIFKWLPSLIGGAVFLLIGLAVFLRKPGERSAQIFYLVNLVTGISMMGRAIFAFQPADLVNQSAFLLFSVFDLVTLWLILPLIVHLLLIFPQKSPLLHKIPWLLPLAYPGLALLSLIIGFARGHNISTRLAAVDEARFSVALIYLLLAASSLLYSFFSVQNRVERNQLRWIVWGFGVGIIPWVFLIALPTALFGQVWMSLDFSNLLLTLIPLAFGFSIVRYRLFDIESLIQRSLLYGFLSLSLASVYSLLVVFLTRLFPYLGFNAASPIAPIVSVIAVAAIFAPAKTRLQDIIDRLFYKDRSAFNRLPIEVSRELSGKVKLPPIIMLLTQKIPKRLQISATELILSDHHNQAWISYQNLQGQLRGISIKNSLVDILKKKSGAVALYDTESLPSQLQPFFEQGVEVLIPLFVNDKLIGLYNFYGKHSGDYYNSEEVEVLSNLGYQAGISISNALSFQRIEQLNLDLKTKAEEYEILYRQERRRAIQLGLISEVSREISSILEIDPLLDTVVQLIRNSFDYDWVSIGLVEEDKDSGAKFLTCVASSGNFAQGESPVGTRALLSDPGVSLRVARTGQPALIKDVSQDLDYIALTGFEKASSELTVALSTQEGIIGVLDLVSARLNAFDSDDLTTIQTLAGQVAVTIENANLYQTQAKQERLKQELAIARNIQSNLLPQQAPTMPGLDIYGYSIPAQEVGGDFFNYVKRGAQKLGVAVGDISGKGLPGSLFMAVSITALRAQAPHYQHSSTLLESLNVLLYPQLRANKMNAAMLYAQFDLEKRQLQVSNAGLIAPLVVSDERNDDSSYLDIGGLPLGAISKAHYQQQSISIHPGDLIIFCSDGIVEAMDSQRSLYGFARLADTISQARAAGMKAEAIVAAAFDDVARFMGGAPQQDDMTLVAVEVTPAGS